MNFFFDLCLALRCGALLSLSYINCSTELSLAAGGEVDHLDNYAK
jgi:hypothetical protein